MGHNIEVSGLDLNRKLGKGLLKQYQGRKKILFKCKNKLSSRSQKPILLAMLNSPTGVLSINNIKYAGNIELWSKKNAKGCDVINSMSLETYLSSLLAKEMNSSWEEEALKAQAVSARTYALIKMRRHKKNKENNFDIENSEKDQVMGSLLDSTSRTQKATKKTRGEVLILSKTKKMTPVFYHARCGGQTLLPQSAWSHSIDGYESVKCEYCRGKGARPWQYQISKKMIRRFLSSKKLSDKIGFKGMQANLNQKLRLVPNNDLTASSIRIYIGKTLVLFSKSILRKFFGRKNIKSLYYNIKKKGSLFIVDGNGLGHGVGLCQVGAQGLAKKGLSYRGILKHYFPNHELYKVY